MSSYLTATADSTIHQIGTQSTFLAWISGLDWWFRVRGYGFSFHRQDDRPLFSCRHRRGQHKRHLIVRGWHLMILIPTPNGRER